MHELQEGREERKREKKKGAIPEVSEKGPKNQHRPRNLSKMGARIEQNRSKIDPKGSQNKDKTGKKSKQPRQDDLGHPLGAISRLSCYSQVPSCVPKSSQIRKKTDAKNH